MSVTSTTTGSAVVKARRSRLTAAAVVIVALLALVFFASSGQQRLREIGFDIDFGYLFATAGFRLAESFVPLPAGASNLMVLGVAFCNALAVAAVAIMGSTVLGFVAALARLSDNPLAARIGRAYVNLVRNVPLIVFLIFLYLTLLQLPSPKASTAMLGGVFLTNRGIVFPSLVFSHLWLGIGLGLLAAGFGVRRIPSRPGWLVPAMVFAAVALVLGTASSTMPVLKGFRFEGGMSISNEFGALAFGMAFYFGAEMAEVIRAGILSVPRSQSEAAAALGLHRATAFRLIIAPQALRLAIPPTINVYVNIIKSTPLGIAVGYSEIMTVTYQIMQNTGRAIESVIVLAVIFMVINAACSLLLNALDRRGGR